jgi:hypothetical protein
MRGCLNNNSKAALSNKQSVLLLALESHGVSIQETHQLSVLINRTNFNKENSYKMNKGTQVFASAVAFLLQLRFIGSYGQGGLEAIVAGAKLPTALWCSTAVYDGNDSVYLFGG